MRGSGRAARWTKLKFSTKISLSRLLIRSGCVGVRFSPHGLIHDISIRRDPRPQRRRALVCTCRAAAGISHRIVRDRPLAALSQRSGLSRKHQGSQISGRNLARSLDARGLCRQFGSSYVLGSPLECGDAAARSNDTRSASAAFASADPATTSNADCCDVREGRWRFFQPSAIRAGDGNARFGRHCRTAAGHRRHRETLSAVAQRIVILFTVLAGAETA
jgi:hypothetical protein